MPADELATRLTGGVTVQELPDEIASASIGRALRADRLRPAAAAEPALHPRHERVDLRRRVAQPDVLAGAPARDAERRGDLPLPPALPRRRLQDLVRRRRPRLGHARAIEGGDIMPVGDGVVLVGMGERSTARAVSILAKQPVRGGRRAARDRRADAARAGGDAPRHGLHVLRPQRRDALRAGRLADPPDPVHARRRRRRAGARCPSARSSTRSRTRSGSTELKLVTTGGDEFEAERNQWDDGNNVVALEPGVVVAYERNEATNAKLAKAGIEVLAIAGPGARPRPRRRPLHDLSRSSATPERSSRR